MAHCPRWYCIAAVKAQMQVLLVAFSNVCWRCQNSASGKIATPVAEQALRIANRMPAANPHMIDSVSRFTCSLIAYRLLRQRRQRRHRGRGFTFALQRRERLVDLFARAAAVHLADHEQRHGVRGIPLLIEFLQLLEIDRPAAPDRAPSSVEPFRR